MRFLGALWAIVLIAQSIWTAPAPAADQYILTVPAAGTYVATISANGMTLSGPHQVITPGGVPAPPPPPPGQTLEQVAATALTAVPSYADRDTHIRGIAFGLNFLGSQLPNSTQPVTSNRAVMQSFLDQAVSTNKDAWTPFFTAINARLDQLASAGQLVTNAQLAAAYAQIQKAVESAIPASVVEDSEEYGGVQTYGLQKANPQFWEFLLNFLLPLLLKLLGIGG